MSLIMLFKRSRQTVKNIARPFLGRFPFVNIRKKLVGFVRISIVDFGDLDDFVKFAVSPYEAANKDEIINILQKRLSGGKWVAAIARLGGRIIGSVRVCSMWKSEGIKEIFVGSAWVHGLFRGLGLGGRMMEAALREAGKKFQQPIYVNIDFDNERSLRMFSKAGFEIVDRRDLARKIENAFIEARGHSKRQLIMKYGRNDKS